MRVLSLVLLCAVCFTGCSPDNEGTAVKETAYSGEVLKITESPRGNPASTTESSAVRTTDDITDFPITPVTEAEKVYAEFIDSIYKDINTAFDEVLQEIDQLVNPNDEDSRMYAFNEDWNANMDEHLRILSGILEHLHEMETVPELYADHHYHTKTGLNLFLSSVEATREASIQADPELLQESGSLYLEAFTHLAQVPHFYPENEE
ncbi:hypothetical protein [Evansella clarkii]|uniref:hypothetical protein n=1 Tax=Evansella clarkii TaxID=79879 RepID=UPI000997C519|nr:hypothetical protein [Evansella clarkii]